MHELDNIRVRYDLHKAAAKSVNSSLYSLLIGWVILGILAPPQ